MDSKEYMTNENGQSLMEVLISIGIIVIIGASITAALSTVMRTNLNAKNTQIADFLLKRVLDEVESVAESDWSKIYNLSPKGTDSQFYTTTSGTALTVLTGATTTAVEGKNFTYWFSVENVNRTKCGLGEITNLATTTCPTTEGAGENEIYEDPSTQKITAYVSWQQLGPSQISAVQYISRKKNLSFIQTDWSGGPNQEIFATTTNSAIINNKFSSSTNIDYSDAGSIKLATTTSQGVLISSTYDTFSTSTAFNTVMWQGLKPSGTNVRFQIAVSNSINGPWNYYGPDGSSASYYAPLTYNTPSNINLRFTKNYRYLRYKIFLSPDSSYSTSSVVYDIIINWSP